MEFVIGTAFGACAVLLVLRLYRAWDRFSAEKVEPYGVQGNGKDDFIKRPRRPQVLPQVRPVVKQASIRSTATERSEA